MSKEKNCDFDIISLYKELGIRKQVLDFGRKIEAGLEGRFAAIDKTAE